MTRRNRVTPFSELIADPARGSLMGNRGVLHDAGGRLTGRRWSTRAWVGCRLACKERHRASMTPGRYTELFFLDGATALAAGHRPCGECRRADYLAFKAAWLEGNGVRPGQGPGGLAAMDARLHAERTARMDGRAVYRVALQGLPDGAMVTRPGERQAWLVLGGLLLAWAPAGYRAAVPRPRGETVALLTPPSTVNALRAGYRPGLHPSHGRWLP